MFLDACEDQHSPILGSALSHGSLEVRSVVDSVESHSFIEVFLCFSLVLLVFNCIYHESVPLSFVKHWIHVVFVLEIKEVVFELPLEELSVKFSELSAAIHFAFFPVACEELTRFKELELTIPIEQIFSEVTFVLIVVGESLLPLPILSISVP